MDEIKPGRSKKDIFVVIVVILLAVMVMGIRQHLVNKAAKESALLSELRSLRMAVQLYMSVNKNAPPDLKVLASQKYDIANKKEPYIKGIGVDKDGYPVDSFGNRFNYDKSKGWVYSSSKDYLKW